MASIGACLVANEPDGLAAKMIQRRIDGVSWKDIADEFNLGSPSTARNTFKKLTGITDFKAKGPALKKLAQEAGHLPGGEAKVAAKAVKEVDNAVEDAAKVVKEATTSPESTQKLLDNKLLEIADNYPADNVENAFAMIKQGKNYVDIASKTGLDIKDIDALNWQYLLDKNAEHGFPGPKTIWKAYKEKPTSQNGFQEVKSLIHELRGQGLTNKEIEQLVDIPHTVVDAVEKGTWKLPAPGATSPVIPAPPPAPPAEFSMTEPIKVGGNFELKSKSDWDAWHVQLGNDLTSEELSAVRSYTGSTYHSINTGLRQGMGHKLTEAIDRSMRPTPFDSMVIRRNNFNAWAEWGIRYRGDFEKLVGKTIQERGFMSTAIQDGHWGGEVRMHISMPKGTMGRWVQPVSMHPSEMEFLLARDTPMVITKVKIPTRGPVDVFVTVI